MALVVLLNHLGDTVDPDQLVVNLLSSGFGTKSQARAGNPVSKFVTLSVGTPLCSYGIESVGSMDHV